MVLISLDETIFTASLAGFGYNVIVLLSSLTPTAGKLIVIVSDEGSQRVTPWFNESWNTAVTKYLQWYGPWVPVGWLSWYVVSPGLLWWITVKTALVVSAR